MSWSSNFRLLQSFLVNTRGLLFFLFLLVCVFFSIRPFDSGLVYVISMIPLSIKGDLDIFGMMACSFIYLLFS